MCSWLGLGRLDDQQFHTLESLDNGQVQVWSPVLKHPSLSSSPWSDACWVTDLGCLETDHDMSLHCSQVTDLGTSVGSLGSDPYVTCWLVKGRGVSSELDLLP